MRHHRSFVLAALTLVPLASAQTLETFAVQTPAASPGEAFGTTIDLDGDRLAARERAGGVNNLGVVHTYRRTTRGWEHEQAIEREDPSGGGGVWAQSFGRSLALEGSLLCIGDFNYGRTSAFIPPLGMVWVYEFDGAQWNLTGNIQRPFVSYGSDVGIDSGRLLISAPGAAAGPNGLRLGHVDVYEKVAGSWTLTGQWTPGGQPALREWGCGINARVSGSYAVMGCLAGQSHPHSYGDVRIFEEQASGWIEVATLDLPVHYNKSGFGKHGLDIEGDWIFVGDPSGPESLAPRPSTVWVFRREPLPPHDWLLFQQIIPPPEISFTTGSFTDKFGWSLAADDGRLIVGAPQAPGGHGVRLYGQALVYEFDGAQWIQTMRLSSNEVEAMGHLGGFLGWSVDVDGPFLAAGDDFAPFGSVMQAGQVYLWERPIGTTTCNAVPNATGLPAVLSARGSDVPGVGVVDFFLSQLPGLSTTLLFAGTQQAHVLNPGGSRGNLCVGGTIVRALLGSTNIAGDLQLTLDLPEPGTSGIVPITAGSTFVFQAWFREPGTPPSSNFTDAVEIGF